MLISGIVAKAQFSEVHVQASGLTCAMCAKSIFKNLETLSFVDKIETDLNTSTFVLVVKPSADVDPDLIRKKVEDAGFAIAGLTLKGRFDGLAVGNDGHFNYGGQTFHMLTAGDKKIEGDASMRLVDKSFVSEKDFKKYSKTTSMECFKTGYAGKCCEKEGIAQGTRIYHVVI